MPTGSRVFGYCSRASRPKRIRYLGFVRDKMQPRDDKRVRLFQSATLETLDNDLLIRCASYLDADGLAQLGRTSTIFGTPQPGQQRSLANQAAHQRFRQSATDEERKCLHKYDDESDIGFYRALELLRRRGDLFALSSWWGTVSALKNTQQVSLKHLAVADGRQQCQGM